MSTVKGLVDKGASSITQLKRSSRIAFVLCFQVWGIWETIVMNLNNNSIKVKF